jgi:magnesium transporter
MARYTNKYRDKVGRAPGTLIHVGKASGAGSRITLIRYDEHTLEEKQPASAAQAKKEVTGQGVTWINVDGVHQTDLISGLGEAFGIHPLVLSDIVNTNQRPKGEDYREYLFLVLKMVYAGEADGDLVFEQVSLVVAPGLVISFQEKEGDLFEPVRNRIRNPGGRIRKMGADYLAYALMDTIVDHYFVILEGKGEQIEALEEELLSHPTEKTMHAIHSHKRDMVHLRRSIWPMREVASLLGKGEPPLVQNATLLYVRDLYDHIIQVMDTIESSRDILSGMLDIYLSSVSNRMNAVMKVLTIIATIFMPLTFLAGIYGMNFLHMPELGWRFGYPLVLLLMGIMAGGMLAFFKRKKWL